MKALLLERYGTPGTVALREVPAPQPKTGEIELEVHCAGLNPIDCKLRDKKAWPIVRLSLPAVMGCECAGVVRRVGEGVTRFAAGDRVTVRVATSALGAFAETCCVPESLAASLPPSMTMVEGAALPLAGVTALQGLFEVGGLKAGQTVFIQAGAGGVGTFAIQLARRAGARVVTTASSQGAELVRRLGADQVINYKQTRWQDVVKDVDLVLDMLGGDAVLDAVRAVKPGGTVVGLVGPVTLDTARRMKVPLPFHPIFWAMGRKTEAAAKARGARYAYWFMRPDGAQLLELAARCEKKELEVVVDKVFPFERALDALAYLESGRAKGKVVLQLRG